jgi:hypothetical protein
VIDLVHVLASSQDVNGVLELAVLGVGKTGLDSRRQQARVILYALAHSEPPECFPKCLCFLVTTWLAHDFIQEYRLLELEIELFGEDFLLVPRVGTEEWLLSDWRK